MLINYKGQEIKVGNIDFNSLIEIIEARFAYELQSMYQVIYQDDDDSNPVLIVDDDSLQGACNTLFIFQVNLCQTKNTQLVLEVQNANIDASNYILKRQISTEKSNIYQESLHQINEKLKEYKEQQKYQEIQESIYEVKDEDLTIQNIMQYYQNKLTKFVANYQKQSNEHKAKHYQQYQECFGSLLERMNKKLQNQFELITQQKKEIRQDVENLNEFKQFN
ncbi:unnamed protein product (macronuclear) [Paramecium tetraurelia]|uniref:PB1 domain-containing protein n=1 Tax=Paramecium tetraurelia TaxID=5888 RepID=A0DAK5_PARTE|nr:uncharacterized protein GSPATT00014979001 [Paramecium tetraurelia]CAK80072.1 unnamed protein product [Paramecium tetraurelia]|eukprot:XP_001447469.1 hypothetical protein (macronuclear) [Paramecium tetraurelia strain d4-2]